MVVASFLQKNTQYVSVLTGGYASIHDYFGQHTNEYLKDHDANMCLMCKSLPAGRSRQITTSSSVEGINSIASTSTNSLRSQPSVDLFSKISGAMKSKSIEVTGKFMDYIGNPANSRHTAGVTEKHVSKNEKNGKRYRDVAPVFSIDEDNIDAVIGNDEQNANHDENTKEIVNIQTYVKNSDVIKALKCQEVHMNGYMYDSHLILTKTHLVVLRDLDNKGNAYLIVRRPLSNIVKITAKKRHRDLITFKYGIPDGDELLITDMDRFLIPNASEATALVSKQIINQLDSNPTDNATK